MLLSILLVTGLAAAIPLTASDLTVHEERDASLFSLHSSERRRIDPNAILPIRIALTQRNLDTGYDHLMSVSDPESADFGKHWSVEEIHNHFAPSEATKEAVKAWLESVSKQHVLVTCAEIS